MTNDLPLRVSTDYLVVHSSATPSTMDIGAKTIRKWHVEDRGWKDIGYHYIVRRSGKVERGRPSGTIGAHVKGFNNKSIGICMIGGAERRTLYNSEKVLVPKKNFTRNQYRALARLIAALMEKYPEAKLVGHRDIAENATECPSFDVREWWQHGYSVDPYVEVMKKVSNGNA